MLVPYYPWDTRTDAFSKVPSEDIHTRTLRVGLPHQELTIQRIRDWCHPLREGDSANDLIAMVDTLIAEYEEVTRDNLVELKQ